MAGFHDYVDAVCSRCGTDAIDAMTNPTLLLCSPRLREHFAKEAPRKASVVEQASKRAREVARAALVDVRTVQRAIDTKGASLRSHATRTAVLAAFRACGCADMAELIEEETGK